jgi:hypothetical protein
VKVGELHYISDTAFSFAWFSNSSTLPLLFHFNRDIALEPYLIIGLFLGCFKSELISVEE